MSVIFHLFVWDRINEKVISPSPRNEALIAQRPTRASFPSLSFLGCGVAEGLNFSSIFSKIDVACNHSFKESA